MGCSSSEGKTTDAVLAKSTLLGQAVNASPESLSVIPSHTYQHSGKAMNPVWQPLCAHKEFLCGWGAAFINISCTFPMNKVMFRQQLYGVRFTKAWQQLHAEGLHSLYRGILPPLLQKTTSMSLMFGMYDSFRTSASRNMSAEMEPYRSLIVPTAAWLAGMCEATLAPFERVQMLLQDRQYHGKFTNTLDAFGKLRKYGLREYYRGLSPILFRNGASNVVFFSLREPVKQLLTEPSDPGTSGVQHIMSDFVSGMLLGSTISTFCYPINVVKTRMQTRLGGPFIGFFTAFHIVFQERDRSWRKMFRGVHVNFTRSLISWGIINASYEVLKKTLNCPSSDY